MPEFYRVMLGRASMYAQECREQGFVGADFDIKQDLTNSLPEDWREFNRVFIPIYMEANPGKSRIAAGLSCGFLWTLCQGIRIGDIVLSPNGKGQSFVGEIQSDYRFVPGASQPHQRHLHWLDQTIDRGRMSEALRRSASSIGTVSQISKHREEVSRLIQGETPQPVIISNDESIEDPAIFALDKHLEDFLVVNWSQTPLGRQYDL